MRIIEHGKFFEKGQIICEKCNCIFTYFAEDTIQHNVYENEQEFQVTEIICPECNFIIELNKELINVPNNEDEFNNDENVINNNDEELIDDNNIDDGE